MNWPILQEKMRVHGRLIIAAMAIVTIIHFLYYVFYNPGHLYSCFSDAIYYISIARNLFSGAGFYCGTTVPGTPILTPQNGIVFLELLLMKAGIPDSAILQLTSFINLLFFFYSAYLLYRLGTFFNISKSLATLIIGNFFFSSNIFLAYIIPINDGISLTLSLLGIVLIFKNNEKWEMENCIYLLAISLIGVHFRNQYLLIPLCGALASLIVRQYRSFVAYAAISLVSSLSVFIAYGFLVTDNSGIVNVLHNKSFSFQADMLRTVPQAIAWGFSVLLLKFGDAGGLGITEYTLPYFGVVAALLIAFCLKIAFKREYKPLVISLIILANIAMYSAMVGHTARYLLIIVPLLMILFCVNSKRKLLLHFLLATYLLYGVFISIGRISYYEYKNSGKGRETVKVPPQFESNALLISEDHVTSYFLFNRPAVRDANAPIPETDYIYIFGSNDFIDRQIDKIKAESSNVEMENLGAYWGWGKSPYSLVKMSRGIRN